MEKTKKILDIQQLGAYLNISTSSIRKMIYSNDIPYFKILSKYYFDLEIIDKWIISKHNEIEIGGFENEY